MMKRRLLSYTLSGFFILALLAELACSETYTVREQTSPVSGQPSNQSFTPSNLITLFLAGDVMTGRGIDQVLPHPGDPIIYEPYMKSAKGYVELAERASGPIQKPVTFTYIWGDALKELERIKPDLRLVNLETSITTSDDYWPGKGIQYRMHPENIPVLTAANIDFCALANNHVLDWGYAGLNETLATLERGHINYAGAGQNLGEAEAPAVMAVEGKGRVIVFSYGLITSGIPFSWGASADRSGVNLLKDLSAQTVRQIKEKVKVLKQPGDIIVVSIHWGSNWGYDVPPQQIEFAHRLIDEAGVDVVHGHSSHHVKGLEVYQGRLIVYGSGDFLNDYEGIGGHEDFRSDLALIYFVTVDPVTGKLVKLQMTPLQIKHFRANRASKADAVWLRDLLTREGQRFGTRAEMNPDNTLTLKWD